MSFGRGGSSNNSHAVGIEQFEPRRSKNIRSNTSNGDFDVGQIIPLASVETFPGDYFTLQNSIVVRLNTPQEVTMDNLVATIYITYNRNRVLNSRFRSMLGEKKRGNDTSMFEINMPHLVTTEGFDEFTLMDYLGMATKVPNSVNLLELLAYNNNYNYIHRNSILQDEVYFDADIVADVDWDEVDEDLEYVNRDKFKVLNGNKKKDYATTALDKPQAENPVELITSEQLRIKNDNEFGEASNKSDYVMLTGNHDASNDVWRDGTGYVHNTEPDNRNVNYNGPQDSSGIKFMALQLETLYAQFAQSLFVTEFLNATQIQRDQERLQRGGRLYQSITLSSWNEFIPDAMLEMPELCYMKSFGIRVTPVAQTAMTLDNTTPQGNLSSVLHGDVQTKGCNFRCEDYGYYQVYLMLRTNQRYQSASKRQHSRRGYYDYYKPVFANLGEQAILNKEINHTGNSTDDDVFGFNSIWSEHKFPQKIICGSFRSNSTLSRDYMHYAEDYGDSVVPLNEEFIEQSNVGFKRTNATNVTSSKDCWFDFECVEISNRRMPKFNTPGYLYGN